MLDRLRDAGDQAVQEVVDPLKRRVALPLEDERDIALALLEVEAGEMIVNRRCKRIGLDIAGEVRVRPKYLQVTERKQLFRIRREDRVAADLDAVLRGAHHGRADAFAGGKYGPGKGAVRRALAQRAAQRLTHVAERLGFLAVDVFADA